MKGKSLEAYSKNASKDACRGIPKTPQSMIAGVFKKRLKASFKAIQRRLKEFLRHFFNT
jgi:hypothetical protein